MQYLRDVEQEAFAHEALLEVAAAAFLAGRAGVQPGFSQAALTAVLYYLMRQYLPKTQGIMQMQKPQLAQGLSPPHDFFEPMPTFYDRGPYNDEVHPAGGFWGVTADAGVRQQMLGGPPDPTNTDYLYRAELRGGLSQINPLDAHRWDY